MSQVFWLRSETKEFEYRRALSPDTVTNLINKGHEVFVEESEVSIIKADQYLQAGAKIVKEGSWVNDAPGNAIILGLKALPDNITIFKHTHIFFAHVYKEQDGWIDILSKFKKGKGKVIDLEYMVDDSGRRVCAFGYWAGYVGAALATVFSDKNTRDNAKLSLKEKRAFIDKDSLISFVKEYAQKQGNGIVLGCYGRSGHGATDFFKDVNWEVMGWDRLDTDRGGPFPEILNYDVFVNCVLSLSKINPFVTKELLQQKHQLKVISDVSCDPDSDCNVLPLYTEATTLNDPLITIDSASGDVALVAIDNLPSILPQESTYDFSSQLEKYLINYSEESGPIKNSLDIFNSKIKLLNS